ncbi:MAG TPA: 23S rRNA (adenine(2503)-C(2))-methyltransferase RlmN, partial [Phenylobacterium sp.]
MGVTLDISHAPASPRAAARPNLAGLTRAELAQALVAAEVVRPEKARMRASQLWRWIHHYGVTDFDRMSDVGKEMRASLAEAFTLARPEVVERQVSKDGTRKWLIRTAPGI